jgi:hypothetical protein
MKSQSRNADPDSDSSSEDDEMIAKLREASIDYENIVKEENVNKEQHKVSTSKRPQFEEVFQSDVTPEYQHFVAKKLKALLDE